MDNLLAPAALVLFVTTISALIQAWHWRHQAKASEHAAMGMACDLSRVGRDSYAGGYDAGRKHAIGLMYKIALRADREGRDVLTALRGVDRQPEPSATSSLETQQAAAE